MYQLPDDLILVLNWSVIRSVNDYRVANNKSGWKQLSKKIVMISVLLETALSQQMYLHLTYTHAPLLGPYLWSHIMFSCCKYSSICSYMHGTECLKMLDNCSETIFLIFVQFVMTDLSCMLVFRDEVALILQDITSWEHVKSAAKIILDDAVWA